MKTLKEQWEEYFRCVYPKAVPILQEQETQKAFYAGAVVALRLANEAAKLPMDEAVVQMEKLASEGIDFCDDVLNSLILSTRKN